MRISTHAICVLSFGLFFLLSCSDDDDPGQRTLSFWTDMELTTTDFLQLEVDGTIIDSFVISSSAATCDDESTIPYMLSTNSTATLRILSADGQALEIGAISLEDFSDGISANVDENNVAADISISGSSSDPCTLVRLRW